MWVAVGLILGVAYAISVYCQGWSFNTPVLFVVGRILEVLPLGLFAFITLFSLARVKGIAIPVVGTLLSVVAAIGEFGMSVILVIDVIKGVQEGYVDLISFLRFYSVDLVLAVLSVAFYVGILLLLFAFVYTPRKKEPSEEEPGEIEGFAIVIS